MQKFLRTLMLAAVMLLPMASHAQTMYLTVCDSTASSDKVPFDGYNADADQHNQMIYPASMLTDMDGETILEMVFYINPNASNGSNTAESRLGTWTVSLGETSATTLSGLDNTTTLTQVYQGYFDCSTGTLTLEFDMPYQYNGGNLLVDLNHSAASWNRWYFLGTTTTSDMSYNSYQEESYTFLPKATFTYGQPPACFKVQNATASTVGSNSVTLTWSDTINSGATYTVYNMADTSVVESGITGTTCTITALTPATDYTFGIGTDCGVNGVANGYATVSVFTNCAPMPLPFSETFNASLSSNPCWRGASIVYAEGVVPTLGNNNNWTYQSSVSNGIEAGHYRVNIYGSSCYKWLVTPEIDLAEATSPLLTFDAAFTKYSGTGAATGFEGNATQKFYVLVSTDGGTTWSILSDVSLSSIASENYVTQFVDLSAYDGDTIRLAFYAQSTTSGGDNNLHLDNISINESTGEICYPTTGLTVSNITATSATVTWNSSTVGNYVLYIMNDSSSFMYTDTVADLNTLQPNTEYTVGVTVDCPSGESPMITTSFRTACAAETMPWSENFNSWTSKSPCWSFMSGAFSGTPTTYSSAWSLNSSYGSNIVIDTNALTMNVYSTNRYWAVTPYIEITSDDALLSVDVAVAAWSSATPNYDTDDTLAFAITTDGTNYTTLLVMDNTQLNALTPTYTTLMIPVSGYNDSTVRFAIFAGSAASGGDNRIAIDNVSVTEAPNCLPVVALTVDSTSAESISLSWTGNATNYNVIDMADGSLAATTIETNVTISGLDASTTYTFGVVADCGGLTSDTVQITAMTACVNTCNITIAGEDGYGDGWNGASIEIRQGVSVVGTFTLDYGNATNSASFTVCDGIPVQFVWMSGSYDDEASFTIADGGNAVVYTCSDGSTLTDGATFTTIANACPSCIPAAITVDTATTTSVTISWTGTAVSYDVYNGETFVANVTTNTYTFTGLNPASTYTFGVQAICSATDTANMATVAVMTACADITTLPYMEGFENGLGCWSTVNGSADGYPWFTVSSTSGVTPHSGNNTAISVSYYSDAVHANAWLISPKFILPTIGTGDTLNLSWWHAVSSNYPTELYDVMLSTTTDDTAAFTTTLLAVNPDSTSDWVNKVVDMSAYAGQSVYIAFHHHDSYDQNYLLIDDIALTIGAAPALLPDTLTVTFAVNDATMGTTVPAPGTYQYLSGDTLSFSAMPNTGYIFNGWVIAYGDGSVDSLSVDYISASAPADIFMNYSPMTITALFGTVDPNSDSMQVNVAVNDPTMGTTIPAPGTHYFHVGEVASVVAVPNDGYHLTGWTVNVVSEGVTYVDTTYNYAFDDVFDLFGGWVVSESNAVFTWTVTANFAAGEPPVMHDSVTVNVSVNNETMGVVTPAPGTHYYVLGDTVIMSIMPNPGYRVVAVQMSATHPLLGTLSDETITDSLELAELVGVNDTLIVDDEEMYGMVVNINVIFAAEGTEPTTYSVEVAYDQTKGTVTGAGDYVEGSNVRLVAMPATHYEFYAWLDNNTGDTVGRESVYAIANIDRDYFLTAIFVASTGIDDVDMDNVTIYSNDNVIVVRGAEGKQVTLFDVNGRMLSREARAAENVEFRVNNSGVYLVKVANAAAKRVVVIR